MGGGSSEAPVSTVGASTLNRTCLGQLGAPVCKGAAFRELKNVCRGRLLDLETVAERVATSGLRKSHNIHICLNRCQCYFQAHLKGVFDACVCDA